MGSLCIGNAWKTTTTVNSKMISENYISGDGFKSRTDSLGRASSRTTARTLPADGSWVTTEVFPDGTSQVETYELGVL